MYDEISKILHEESDEEYRIFSSKLLPGVNNILGVRIPSLRKIAMQIAKEDWKSFLRKASNETFEETLLQGFVIAYAEMDLSERFSRIGQFVPHIDNWSICDSFCNSLKFTLQNKKEVWEFLQPYFLSDKPYHLRFAIVMLLNYYIEEEFLDPICKILESIHHDNYYVKMAVAWAISTCFVKFPDQMLTYLEGCKLDTFTYKKTVQKIHESYKVSNGFKQQLKKQAAEKGKLLG
ncbi:MAG: DNA alkylation repair protein [Lachnospiraceae bacterium]